MIGDLVVVERKQGLARGQPEGWAGFPDPEVRPALEPIAIDLSEGECASAGAFGDVARAGEEPFRAVQKTGIRREMEGAVGVGIVADEEVDPAVGGDEDRLSRDGEVARAGGRGKNGETAEKEQRGAPIGPTPACRGNERGECDEPAGEKKAGLGEGRGTEAEPDRERGAPSAPEDERQLEEKHREGYGEEFTLEEHEWPVEGASGCGHDGPDRPGQTPSQDPEETHPGNSERELHRAGSGQPEAEGVQGPQKPWVERPLGVRGAGGGS